MILVALDCNVATPSGATACLSRRDIVFAAITEQMRPMSWRADKADEPMRLVMQRLPRPMRPMRPMRLMSWGTRSMSQWGWWCGQGQGWWGRWGQRCSGQQEHCDQRGHWVLLLLLLLTLFLLGFCSPVSVQQCHYPLLPHKMFCNLCRSERIFRNNCTGQSARTKELVLPQNERLKWAWCWKRLKRQLLWWKQ